MSPFSSSVFAIRNKRRKMEDRHVIVPDLNSLLDLKDVPPHSYFAVFDGHAGVDAADFAAAYLHMNIARHPEFLTDTPQAIKEAFKLTDAEFEKKSIEEGFRSGCTAVCALIREDTLYLAWLGDSQAVLIRSGRPVEIMVPHKPNRPDERERIEHLGGFVCHLGTWRVNGTLAVSRAIGDYEFKPYVSGEPEVNVISLDGQEDFIILACDGLWDTIAPDDAVGIVYRHLHESAPDIAANSVAEKLVHQSKQQGSDDNITVVVIFLKSISEILSNVPKNVLEAKQRGNIEHQVDLLGQQRNIPERPNHLQNIFAFPSLCTDSMGSDAVPQETSMLSELPTPPIDDIDSGKTLYEYPAVEKLDVARNAPNFSSVGHIVNNLRDSHTTCAAKTDISTLPQTPSSDDYKIQETDTSQLKNDDIMKTTPSKEITEAVNIASAIVSNTIETAMKDISTSQVHIENLTSNKNSVAEPSVENSVNYVTGCSSCINEICNCVAKNTDETAIQSAAETTLFTNTGDYGCMNSHNSEASKSIEAENAINSIHSQQNDKNNEINISKSVASFGILNQSLEPSLFIENVSETSDLKNVLLPPASEHSDQILVNPNYNDALPREESHSELLKDVFTSAIDHGEPEIAGLKECFQPPANIQGNLQGIVVANSEVTVEDSHASEVAVDLQAVPDGVPEAEGVCEDIDSDSEKDGGWSYVKAGSEGSPGNKYLNPEEDKGNEVSSLVSVTSCAKTPTLSLQKDKLIKSKRDSAVKPKVLGAAKSIAKTPSEKPKVPSSKALNDKPKTPTSARGTLKVPENKTKVSSPVNHSVKILNGKQRTPDSVNAIKTLDGRRSLSCPKPPASTLKPSEKVKSSKPLSAGGISSVTTVTSKPSSTTGISSTTTVSSKPLPTSRISSATSKPSPTSRISSATSKPSSTSRISSTAKVSVSQLGANIASSRITVRPNVPSAASRALKEQPRILEKPRVSTIKTTNAASSLKRPAATQSATKAKSSALPHNTESLVKSTGSTKTVTQKSNVARSVADYATSVPKSRASIFKRPENKEIKNNANKPVVSDKVAQLAQQKGASMAANVKKTSTLKEVASRASSAVTRNVLNKNIQLKPSSTAPKTIRNNLKIKSNVAIKSNISSDAKINAHKHESKVSEVENSSETNSELESNKTGSQENSQLNVCSSETTIVEKQEVLLAINSQAEANKTDSQENSQLTSGCSEVRSAGNELDFLINAEVEGNKTEAKPNTLCNPEVASPENQELILLVNPEVETGKATNVEAETGKATNVEAETGRAVSTEENPELLVCCPEIAATKNQDLILTNSEAENNKNSEAENNKRNSHENSQYNACCLEQEEVNDKSFVTSHDLNDATRSNQL